MVGGYRATRRQGIEGDRGGGRERHAKKRHTKKPNHAQADQVETREKKEGDKTNEANKSQKHANKTRQVAVRYPRPSWRMSFGAGRAQSRGRDPWSPPERLPRPCCPKARGGVAMAVAVVVSCCRGGDKDGGAQHHDAVAVWGQGDNSHQSSSPVVSPATPPRRHATSTPKQQAHQNSINNNEAHPRSSSAGSRDSSGGKASFRTDNS